MPEDLALRYVDRPLSASLPLPSSKGGYSSVVREPLVERPARLSQTMTSVAESPLRRSYAEDPRARRSESDRMFVSEGPDGRRIVTREGSDGQRYAVSATESDRVLGGLSGARTDLARRPATAQPSFAPRMESRTERVVMREGPDGVRHMVSDSHAHLRLPTEVDRHPALEAPTQVHTVFDRGPMPVVERVTLDNGQPVQPLGPQVVDTVRIPADTTTLVEHVYEKGEAEKPKKPAGLKLDQGIDLGCKGFAVVCWVEFPCLKEGSSTKAILSGDGERHHLALWRADAHGAMEAGMISENRYKPFTPVSRDAPSLDRLTGWHMLALVGSAAEVRRRARGAAGDFISEGGRDARTYLYVDGAKWGHTASIVDCALKAFGCPTTRIQVAGKQLPEFPSSHTTVEVYTMALDDKQVAARFLSASGMSGGGGTMITAADAAAAAAGGGVLANAGALSSALSLARSDEIDALTAEHTATTKEAEELAKEVKPEEEEKARTALSTCDTKIAALSTQRQELLMKLREIEDGIGTENAARATAQTQYDALAAARAKHEYATRRQQMLHLKLEAAQGLYEAAKRFQEVSAAAMP